MQKKSRQITGWINLDKPYGMSSSQAVAKVKYLLQAAKAGHAGTLDPLATGMLPIALGEATKLIPYIMADKKYYSFQISWGEERNTDDLEGAVINSTDKKPKENEILSILPAYIGEILQTPPQFSAIKCNGQRAYDLARQGKTVDIAARKVMIEEIKLISHDADNNKSNFSIICGKGTYIRSLGRDIGRALNCYGYISKLRRTKVQPFDENSMIELSELSLLAQPDSCLINNTALLTAYSRYEISQEQAEAVKQGQKIILPHVTQMIKPTACLIYQNQLLSIGNIESNIFCPKRVFKS